ncbi:MAG TPA: lamin tail domain-containing protein [Patescibacteria group bacterium]|nr:lamin tail domain-containing protein [Patescibacteria group bacterium]
MKMLVVSIALLGAIVGVYFIRYENASAQNSHLVFTEIMYDAEGSDTKREWIEIYNPTDTPITIIEGAGDGSWRFFDSSNHTLTLIKGSAIIPVASVAIIASDSATFMAEHPSFSGTLFDTTMSLNNTSATLKLSNDKGLTFFETVSYASDWGGAGDGFSLEKIDPDETNDKTNWQQSAYKGGSPGEVTISSKQPQPNPNPVPSSESGASSPSSSASYPDGVVINELYPWPRDTEDECIELANQTEQTIDISLWIISDSSGKKYTIPQQTTIPSYGLITLYREKTKIVLNNSNDTISLMFPSSKIASKTSYTQAKQGMSWARNEEDEFQWSKTPTPNTINVFPQPPYATIKADPLFADINQSITLDSVGSVGTILEWSIPDAPLFTTPKLSYAFSKPGNYPITLTAKNSINETAQNSVTVTVIDQNNPDISILIPQTKHTNVILSELLPNPTGNDKNEWIEIYNPTSTTVDITNWAVGKEEDGRNVYVISDQTTIAPGTYLIIPRILSKITLTNTDDTVYFFDAKKNIADKITYSESEEGASFARDADDIWLWTYTPTPGEANKFAEKFTPLPVSLSSASLQSQSTDPMIVELSDIRDIENGAWVITEGIVTVQPPAFGPTQFYIMNGSGIQIYSAKKDFPTLALGDKIRVTGTLSESQGEKRIKISAQKDITVLAQGTPAAPQEIAIADISQNEEGMLITFSGTVLETSGRTIFVRDDSDAEIKVYYKENIEKPKISENMDITITGIVSETSSGLRVLPRFGEDTILTSVEPVPSEQADGEVAGIRLQETAQIPNELPQKQQSFSLPTAILITLGILSIIQTAVIVYLLKQKPHTTP